jgi:hypothetical protein
MTTPEEIWGAKFKDKYKTAMAKSYKDRTQVTPAMRREIIGLVRSHFDGEKVAMQYPRDSITYDVILVQAPKSMNPRTFDSGDLSLGMLWKGTWVGAVMSEEKYRDLEPDKFYVLVGFLKIKEPYKNFYVRSIITMEQVKNADIGNKTLDNANELHGSEITLDVKE